MARGNNNLYIRLDTVGSAARQPEPARQPAPRRKVPKPRLRAVQVTRIYIDPLALVGIVVAVGLLIALAMGCAQLTQAQRERDTMAGYVEQLQEQNNSLRQTYRETVDLEQVEQAALAAGLVPVEQVTQIPIVVEEEEEVLPELTLWQRLGAFFEGLFA